MKMMAACSKLYVPNIGHNLPLQDTFSFSERETVDENDDDDADSDFSVLNPTHFLSTTFYEEHGTLLDEKKASKTQTKHSGKQEKHVGMQKLEMSPQKLHKHSIMKEACVDAEPSNQFPKLHTTDQVTCTESKCEMGSSEEIEDSFDQNVKKNEVDHTNAKDLKTVDKKYVCEQCKYACKCKTDLLNHLKTHTEQDKVLFSCNLCSKEFKHKSALLHHAETHRGKLNDKKALTCKICKKTYKKSGSLAKHELEHEGKGQFKCRFCGDVFVSDAERTRHREKFHEKQWKCSTCHHTFATEGKLQTHMRWHENKELEVYVCNVCSKEFKLKVNLKIHVESKCGTDPQHVCQTCGKAFMTRGTLITHTLLHTGEKTFLCRFCGKSFRLKVEMQRHERSHTGEKPFVCKVCNKAFAHRESLVTHNTLHTGIRPYMCETCGSTFSCIGNLIKHKKTHRNTCGIVTQKPHNNTLRGASKKTYSKTNNVSEKLDPNLQSVNSQKNSANVGITAPAFYNYKQPSFEENAEWLPQQSFFNNHTQNERIYSSVDTHIIDKAFKSSHIYWGSGNNIMGMPQEGIQYPFGVYNGASRNARHSMMQTHILYASPSEESILQHRQIPADNFLHNFDGNKVHCSHRPQNFDGEKFLYGNYRHYNWDIGRTASGFKQEGDNSLQRDANRIPQNDVEHNSQQVQSTREFIGMANAPAHSVVDSHHSYQLIGADRQQVCQGPVSEENESSPSFMSDYVDRPNTYLAAGVDFSMSSSLPVEMNSKHDRPEYQLETVNPGENAINNVEQVLDKTIANEQNVKNLSSVNDSFMKAKTNNEDHHSFGNSSAGSNVTEKNTSVCGAKILAGCVLDNKSKMQDEASEANESAEVRYVRERKQKCPIKCDLSVAKYIKDKNHSRDSINNCDESRMDGCVPPVDFSKEDSVVHTAEKVCISCLHCSLKFPDEALLQNHMSSHHQQNNVENDDSEDDTPLIQRLNHLSFEKKLGDLNNSKKFVCNYCKKEFCLESHFKRHVKVHVPNVEVPPCCFCGKKYLNKACLLKHEAQHTSTGAFKCRECDEFFDTRAAYKQHRLVHVGKQHTCTECRRTFCSASNLKIHMSHKHLGQTPETFACQLCGKKFKQKGNLKVHMDSRCGSEPRHVCSVCGKAFMSVGSLTTHFLLHTGEKTFLCRFCGKSFRLKVEMQRHERSHTGEKPFVCKVCGKAFAHRESLVTHNTLHTGIRPYMCEACGCTFSCIGNLIKHKQTHNKRCHNSEK